MFETRSKRTEIGGSALLHPKHQIANSSRLAIRQKSCLVNTNVPRVDRGRVFGARAVTNVWANKDNGAALILSVVIIPHEKSTHAVTRHHYSGATETHLLRIIVKFHRGEHRAQVQLWNVVEDSQGQH